MLESHHFGIFVFSRVIRKVSWREGFGPGFEKIVWQALKVEQVSVAIKKHRHKSFEDRKWWKKNSSCVASAPREFGVALSEGLLHRSRWRCFTNSQCTPKISKFSHPKTSRPALKLSHGLVYYAPESKSLTLRFHGFVWIVHSKFVKTQAYFTDNSSVLWYFMPIH